MSLPRIDDSSYSGAISMPESVRLTLGESTMHLSDYERGAEPEIREVCA